ncbi:hypothetical protein GCM10027569_36910 [Flindersiella endophytica]
MEAEQLVAELNDSAGTGLRLEGVAAHGEVSGAAYVRWPDGRPGVVTTSPSAVGFLEFVGDVLNLARSRGALVPRYDVVTELAGSSVIVQERMPGSPVEQVDHETIDAIVAACESFAGLLFDRPEVSAPELFLQGSGDDFCLHETLETYDARSRKLLGWIREVGRTAPATLPGDDLVHWDLVPGNILMDDGAVTGIVDWDGIGRGHRGFSLVKLRFSLERGQALRPAGYPEVAAGAIGRLDEWLRNVMEPDVFRLCWAHWSLSMIDWAIRHNPRADVDVYLELAAARLG